MGNWDSSDVSANLIAGLQEPIGFTIAANTFCWLECQWNDGLLLSNHERQNHNGAYLQARFLPLQAPLARVQELLVPGCVDDWGVFDSIRFDPIHTGRRNVPLPRRQIRTRGTAIHQRTSRVGGTRKAGGHWKSNCSLNCKTCYSVDAISEGRGEGNGPGFCVGSHCSSRQINGRKFSGCAQEGTGNVDQSVRNQVGPARCGQHHVRHQKNSSNARPY